MLQPRPDRSDRGADTKQIDQAASFSSPVLQTNVKRRARRTNKSSYEILARCLSRSASSQMSLLLTDSITRPIMPLKQMEMRCCGWSGRVQTGGRRKGTIPLLGARALKSESSQLFEGNKLSTLTLTMAPSRASPFPLISRARSPIFAAPHRRLPIQCLRQPQRIQHVRPFASSSPRYAGIQSGIDISAEASKHSRGSRGQDFSSPAVQQQQYIENISRDLPTDLGLIPLTFIFPRGPEKSIGWTENWRQRLSLERGQLTAYWHQLVSYVDLEGEGARC